MTWAQFEDRLALLVRARNQLELNHAALLDQLGREGHPQLSPDGDRVHVAGRPDVEIMNLPVHISLSRWTGGEAGTSFRLTVSDDSSGT